MTSRNSLFIAGISYFRSTIVIAINYYNMIFGIIQLCSLLFLALILKNIKSIGKKNICLN